MRTRSIAYTHAGRRTRCIRECKRMHAPTPRARSYRRRTTRNSTTSLYHTCNRMTRTKRRNRPLPYVKQFLVPLVASRRCRYGTAVACIRIGITSATEKKKKERETDREKREKELEPLQHLSLLSLLCIALSFFLYPPRIFVSLSFFFSPSLSLSLIFLILSVSLAETSPEKSY